MIAALVEKGVWLPSQGLSYARALLPGERADALIRISAHLDDREKGTVLKEALKAARGIENASDRARVLKVLASQLAKLGQVEERWRRRGGSRTRGIEPGCWWRWFPAWRNWVEWRRR